MGEGRCTLCLGYRHGSEATLEQHAVEQGFISLGGVVESNEIPSSQVVWLVRIELIPQNLRIDAS
ncbi:hypothetical protein LGKMAHEF_00564 [Aeromonas salmonicida]